MPCTNTLEKGHMLRGPIAEGDYLATVLVSRHVRGTTQKLNWLCKDTNTVFKMQLYRWSVDLLPVCFMSGKMLKHFAIFTHARITHFDIKVRIFSRDRVYLLFLNQMAAFYKQKFGIFPFSVSVNNKSRCWWIWRHTFCTDDVRVFTHRLSSQSITIFWRESSWIHKSLKLVSTHLH